MSSANSSISWDLRCYVREKLVEFLRERYPESLPRTRTEITGIPDGRLLDLEKKRSGEFQPAA